MKFITSLFLAVVLGSSAMAADQHNPYIGAEYGAYKNDQEQIIVAKESDASVMSLAGEWHYALDADNKGVEEQWFNHALSKPIKLPGTLDEAGYGKPCDERTLQHLNRRFEFIGPAWYQREVTIPADWAGKRIMLRLERVTWESRVWVDDRPCGARDSLCTPQEYDLTCVLTPGIHRLTVRVDNSGRPGANAHGYGDDQQIRWNGLLGRLELRAQDVVHIREVQIYPDLALKRAIIQVEIGSIAGGSADGRVTVTARLKGASDNPWLPSVGANFKIAGETLPVEVALPLGPQPATWDEFAPQLYEVKVEMAAETEGRKMSDSATATFGLRELGHQGTQLTMNGRTLFLRGTHDGGGFPLTGHPAMDVEGWRKIFRTCKEYGLNYVRYHSFCPPEEAFEAADQEGIYLQVELPFWGEVGPEWSGTAFLRAELLRILDAYGNHPSFCLMTMGNEHSGDWDVLARFVDEAKRHDPRHLYVATSNEYIRMGNDHKAINPGDEFAVIMQGPKPENGFEQGRIRYLERFKNGEAPAFDADYRDIVQQFDVPVIAHELGQWWIYPDVSEAAKYIGVLRSGAMELFRQSLAAAGILDRDEEFHRASGALAVQLYKEDIERELRTPGLGGFALLDLHDYTGQNTSLVGILDPFWESKGLILPPEFRRFCSPTVPLARFSKAIWNNDERLTVHFEVAHYGPTNLTGITPQWNLMYDDGRVVTGGCLPEQNCIPTGTNTDLGEISVPLAPVARPAQLKLEMSLAGATNDWSLWVYPAPDLRLLASDNLPPNVRLCERLDPDTLSFLTNGGRVLLLGQNSAHTVPTEFPNPAWNPFDDNRTSCGLFIAAQHPALAEFPTETHSDWQWRGLLEPEARTFVLNELPSDARPIVATIDEPLRAFRLGVLFEARVGRGVLLATSLDLVSDLEHREAARQLRRSLVNYLAGKACHPTITLDVNQALKLINGDRFHLGDGPPADGKVVLDVLASVFAPTDTQSQWKKNYDRVVVQDPGLDYTFPPSQFDPDNIPAVSWRNNGHPAWMSSRFTLRLQCPPNFYGEAFVLFKDDDSGNAVGAVQSGRDACYVGHHSGAGKWVSLRITPADIKAGGLNLTFFKPEGGDSWLRAPRITRLTVVSMP